MKQNKKLRKIGIGCLATLMAILFSMPVMAADNGPELLVTKGESANQVNLTLTNLGDKAIKGFSLELKISGDGAAFTGAIQAGSPLSTEDSRVKIITKNDGKEATLAVTRKGQLPAGKIDIGTLTVKGKTGEKYTIEASHLEMVDVSDYQKSTVELIGLDKDSDDNMVIEHQDTSDPDQKPDTRPDSPENGQDNENPDSTENLAAPSSAGPYGSGNPSTGVITDPGAAAFITSGILIVMLAGLMAFKRKKIL